MSTPPSPTARAARAAFVACALALSPALAQNGPGLGNLSYPQGDHMKKIAGVGGGQGAPRGHGYVTMHRGYLLVIFSFDGGGGNGTGGFAFLDVSDPRKPREVFSTDGNPAYGRGTPNDARDIREAHGFGISGDILCTPTNKGRGTGLQFWDLSNPRLPQKVGSLDLPGLTGGDYAPTPWWVCWQGGRYVYVAGTSAGLFIVDASDPAQPILADRGGPPNPIPPQQVGVSRVNVVHAVGNLLVAANASGRGLATLDIGDPLHPVLLDAEDLDAGYSIMVNGGRIYAASDPAKVYDISDPADIRHLADGPDVADKGGYGVIQDGVFHYGSSDRYVKLDVSGPTPTSLGTVRPRFYLFPDWDFATALGNLVFMGNDHIGGGALVVHDTQPDTTGPAVTMVVPADGATAQPLTTRIGLTFSDQVDLSSVDPSTLVVRRRGPGTVVSGRTSHQHGLVNFWPDQPLEPNAVYEVVVPAGGIRDLVGNPTATDFTSAFSTGASLPSRMVVAPTPSAPSEVGAPATLQATSVTGASGLPEFSWDLGDGTATPWSPSPTVVHTYAAPGHYRVLLRVRTLGGLQWTSTSWIHTVHRPLTPDAPVTSETLLHDPSRGRVWSVNPDNHTVTASDAAARAKLLEVPVGAGPRSLARAPDGTLWVACADGDGLWVVHPDDGRTLATVRFSPGSRPSGVVFPAGSPDAYVTLEGSGQVAHVDGQARAVLRTTDVGPWPRGLAATADGRTLLVSRFISAQAQGEVRLVDVPTLQAVQTVDLALDPGPDREDSGRGVPNYLGAPAVSPDGAVAWVPAKKDNTVRGAFVDGQPLTFESSVRAIACQLDLANAREDLSARIDFNDRALPRAVAFSPHGDWAFVALQGSNAVEVRDAYDGSLALAIERTGGAPDGVLLVGSELWVHNFTTRELTVYDVADLLSGAASAATELARIDAVGSERLAPDVLRGKQVFYDASDPRMSLDGYVSCAACHLDGGQDGRVWDFTDRGEGLRNTIDLRGRGGVAQGPLHWSANFDEVQDFEHDIRGPFGGTGLMRDADFHSGSRSSPLGTPKAGVSADLDALAAYVSSLREVGRSPHREASGALTPAGVRGRAVFVAQGCADCHGGAGFTDSPLGLRHDVGTFGPGSGARLGGLLDGLDTPTLRGLWNSAPYLHDGSAQTLEEVLRRSGPQHGDMASLSPADQQDLIAFLRQVDDAEPAAPLGPAAVRILAPVGVLTIRGGGVAVEYLAGGDLSGVSHAALSLDGGPLQHDRDFDGQAALVGVPHGPHTLEVVLLDAAGVPLPGSRARASVQFTVDAVLELTGVRTRLQAPDKDDPATWTTSHPTGVLAHGARVYDDRRYTFASLAGLSGALYVQTANRDKYERGRRFLAFEVNRPVTVYVAFDDRAWFRPGWLRGWSKASDMILTDDTERRLFKKDFPPGTVVLGGNGVLGARSMYTPIVVPR
jgi:hypothetical protein